MATEAAPRGRKRQEATEPRPERKPGPIRSFFTEAGDFVGFMAETLRDLPRTYQFFAEVLRQASILVRGSTVYIAAMSAFIGFAITTVGYFFLRSAAASDYLGVFTGITTPRASAPIMFGYAFAAKVGCGMVAEIGAMRINDEIDALEVEGVNPMAYVVGSRVLGALLFVPLAVAASLLAQTAAVFVDATVVLQALPGSSLMRNHWGSQNFQDLIFALINMGATAMMMVIVACYFGYRTKGGAAGVGASVAKSMVVNLVLIHVMSSFFVSLFYGPDPRLPIGG